MKKFGNALVKFLKNEDGPTAVEYAVMLALIIVVCITAITTLGTNANNTFSYVGAQIGGSGRLDDLTRRGSPIVEASRIHFSLSEKREAHA